jgi:hypothetical protein
MIVIGSVSTQARRMCFTVSLCIHAFFPVIIHPAILDENICVVLTGSQRREAKLIVIAVIIAELADSAYLSL